MIQFKNQAFLGTNSYGENQKSRFDLQRFTLGCAPHWQKSLHIWGEQSALQGSKVPLNS